MLKGLLIKHTSLTVLQPLRNIPLLKITFGADGKNWAENMAGILNSSVCLQDT